MKNILIILLVVVIVAPAFAGHVLPERWYQDRWCAEYGGITEYRLKGGVRCDCLIPGENGYAVEVDFAKTKWYEGVGQALHYARLTGLTPGLLLIVEKPSDMQYVRDAISLGDFYGIELRVWVIYSYRLTFRGGR